MWVKSQDKLRIINADSFAIKNNSLEMAAVDSIDSSKWIINDLAEYSSLEKAKCALNLLEASIKAGRNYFEFPGEDDV